MITRRLSATLAIASLVLVACGSDQDPAIDVPTDEATTTTTSRVEPAAGGQPMTFGPIELTGDAEVPGPGDEDGAGQAHVYLEPEGEPAGTICYDFIGIDGIEPATAAHIHEGEVGEAGDVVLPLETPSEGSLDACAQDQAELVAQIAANPAGFYINVHNEDFPEGAVRGQLEE
ncbi:MAG: CHRD domain-containing protein [Actinomycetota bacterium]|nr:CHRD domain-containing protein [Actinomycetota bacterium]